jgi:hypothetical protein
MGTSKREVTSSETTGSSSTTRIMRPVNSMRALWSPLRAVSQERWPRSTSLVSSGRNAAIRGPFLASPCRQRYEGEDLERTRHATQTQRGEFPFAKLRVRRTDNGRQAQEAAPAGPKNWQDHLCDGSFTVDCIIRNQSQIGARYRFRYPGRFPTGLFFSKP